MNKTIISSFIMIDSKRSKKKSIQRNQAEQEVETQDLNAKISNSDGNKTRSGRSHVWNPFG